MKYANTTGGGAAVLHLNTRGRLTSPSAHDTVLLEGCPPKTKSNERRFQDWIGSLLVFLKTDSILFVSPDGIHVLRKIGLLADPTFFNMLICHTVLIITVYSYHCYYYMGNLT